MNNLEQTGEDLLLAGRLVQLLTIEHNQGRANAYELERALIALDRANRKHDEALLKELGVWESLEPIK